MMDRATVDIGLAGINLNGMAVRLGLDYAPMPSLRVTGLLRLHLLNYFHH